MKKWINIDQVRPGMCVEKIDRSWISTPFFSHHIGEVSADKIQQLKACGVRSVEVIVDDQIDQDDQKEYASASESYAEPDPPDPIDDIDESTALGEGGLLARWDVKWRTIDRVAGPSIAAELPLEQAAIEDARRVVPA